MHGFVAAVGRETAPPTAPGWRPVIENYTLNLCRLQINNAHTLLEDAENLPSPLPFFQSALVYGMMR